jgi:hypothetical protein
MTHAQPHTLVAAFCPRQRGKSSFIVGLKKQVHFGYFHAHFSVARCFLDCSYDRLSRMNLVLFFHEEDVTEIVGLMAKFLAQHRSERFKQKL